MPQNKTLPTTVDPQSFISTIEHPVRQHDAQTLLRLFGECCSDPAVMWGQSIIGYGHYHYCYNSGHCGEFFRVGFAPRKANMVIYIMPGYTDFSEILQRLGRHRLGKSCLYINKLSDINLSVLSELILMGLQTMEKLYPTNTP